ncbi:8-oxo-dGTP diphosphatase MutT [Parasporobacterium paucivorans]|uniref:8-oxo-dGTP diphosphatase n=1 Tax=Parasporobacterium paucivorans DSM 15970 TaxID=1122934 RepID=A0A1M6LMT5_9FIRM|nr:8-oxo-dGTP diphosphatase MutT [Parasporobacterium paucivorans]SHJ72455.1 8-oxo-dGTP diphosphatase [Parasporobacterium paucivorans DSM 15970]
MKTIHVAAAIIRQNNEFFATQRGYGEFAGGWEFPGGKIEAGETPEQALVREIQEELGTEISIDRHFTTVEYSYPSFHLHMECFLCSVQNGSLELLEHSDSKWLGKDDLNSVEWLAADVTIIEKLKAIF